MANPEGSGDDPVDHQGDRQIRSRQPTPRHRRLTPRVDPPVMPLQEPHYVMIARTPDRVSNDELDAINEAASKAGGFMGEATMFAAYDRQNGRERGDASGMAQQRNADWIAAAFSAFPSLAWIEVLGGKVVRAGRSTSDMPDDIDVYDEGKERGTVSYRFRKNQPVIGDIVCAEVGREVGDVLSRSS